ncbi:MAG TPA: hypothetical protein VFX39_02925 [Gemmatimonadaceae bacterium]|nr:hypothetical protein [Gemmatimonadaceae bacterium]
MGKWLKRIRGALGMGLTWAAAWALTGILIGATSVLLPWLPWWDDFFRVFDAPLPALAVPGFVGGVLFSTVLGIAGRRRSFHELSLPRITVWGAGGGLLLSMVPDAMMTVGLASPGPDPIYGPWEFAATVAPFLTVLCAASAAGTLALARRAERRGLIDASPDAVDAALVDGGAEALLPAGRGSATDALKQEGDWPGVASPPRSPVNVRRAPP